MLDDSDITALFRKYQHRADRIPRPIVLETNIQELLAMGDVLFLGRNQYSSMKLSIFGEELLDKLLDDQKRALLSKVPESCPDFTMDDYTAVLKVMCSIDEKVITPKQAKLQLLSLAGGMNSLKGNVIEGIADL